MDNRFSTALRRSGTACVLAAFGLTGNASATLLDRGPNFVYDDVLNITWTRNANLPGSFGLHWADATAWAEDIVYGGYDDWRLPHASVSLAPAPVTCATASESACRDNEMGYMFYYNLGGSFGSDETGDQTALGGQHLTGIQQVYWSGQSSGPGGAWAFYFRGSAQGSFGELNKIISVWIVRDGDVVPEPSSSLVIVVGLLALLSKRYGARLRF